VTLSASATHHLDARSGTHHDASIRTTVTLDPDVARMLEEEVHRARKPFKQVLNETIRRGLSPRTSEQRVPRFRVRVHAAKCIAGYDAGRLNALADELEDAAILTGHRPSPP
jgi:hypothetical protein